MHAVILLKCGRGGSSGGGVDFGAEIFLLKLGLIVFVEEGGEAFGLGKEMVDIVGLEVMLSFVELMLEVGGHFFHFQLNIIGEDLVVDVHDADGNVGR
jgi:hypothetical protein